MIPAILGTKIHQSQQFTEEGKRIPVTVIAAGPCWVSRVSEAGLMRRYQLAFGTVKNITKALAGHMKKAGLETKPRFLREISVKSTDETINVGTEIKVGDVLAVGDTVRVTGTSKGKGFAGVVKRHGFAGGPRTHGQSDRERAPGSIGQTTTPGRVYRGKRMAGRMGNDRVTIPSLKVVAVDAEKQTVTVSGLIPGARDSLVIIEKE